VKRYLVLTNRKRAIIALVHTVAFLALSFIGFVTVVRPLKASSPVSSWLLAAVFLVVSAVLLALSVASRHAVERLYFGLCATSAVFGLARQVVGDAGAHRAVYIRVAMLACAVAVGVRILRSHGAAAAPARRPAAESDHAGV
jgi:hypothetical protein